MFGEFPAAAFEHVHDGGIGDDLVLGADLALEQERHRRAAPPLFRVVAGQQGDGLAASGVTADDGRDHGEQLGGHGDDTFPVALRRGDYKQGDDVAVGPLVLPDAEMGKFKSFFYANTRVPQDLHDRPLPEGGVFGMRDADVLAAIQVESADVCWSSEPDASFIDPAPQMPVGAALDSDGFSAGCARDLGQKLTEMAIPVLHVFHQGAQHRLAVSHGRSRVLAARRPLARHRVTHSSSRPQP